MSAARLDVGRKTYATSAVAGEAAGALAGQSVVDRLRDEWTTADLAWLAFTELAAEHGWRSPACRAFILELAKRASK